jgi:tetratricopeptide (TPR) repeat protein
VKDASEDLSVRARRGELDEGARKQLALLLSGSLEARLLHRAGCEFDAQDSVLPGDEALAQRITERLLLARPAPTRSPRRWLKPALTAGVVGALTLAAALALRQSGRAGAPLPAPSVMQPSLPNQGAAKAGARGGVVVPRTPSALPSAKESAPSSPATAQTVEPKPSSAKSVARRAVAEVTPAASALGTSESASALFASANRARREAEPERAVALYERLQQRFPSAPEALASELALGMLQLRRGAPDAALRHFSAYLARAPQGALGSEALWGQARAYLALGQPDSAKKSFRALLSQYPESAYAGAARAKLQALP